MGRPKGFSQAGIYPRTKHIRIPAAAEAYVRAAVWAWEVAEVRCEVKELHRALREYVAATRATSKSQAKRQAQAKRAKSKTSPATRKTAGIKKHTAPKGGDVSSVPSVSP